MAKRPTPGGTDLCFESQKVPTAILRHLQKAGAKIVAGPVIKHGARGRMTSLYVRDPDGSLIEVCSYR